MAGSMKLKAELKRKSIEKLKADLTENQKEIEGAEIREKVLKTDFKTNEFEQLSWQPKLEKVTGLDTRIVNLQESK